MKKKIFLRGAIGLPIGISIGTIISLIISISIGDGKLHLVATTFIDSVGNELTATIIQTILCGIMGMGFGMASIIWELDNWSLALQSGIYFLVISCIMLPIAYVTNWMEHSFVGFITYFGMFIGIFITIWISQYFVWRAKIKKINKEIKAN